MHKAGSHRYCTGRSSHARPRRSSPGNRPPALGGRLRKNGSGWGSRERDRRKFPAIENWTDFRRPHAPSHLAPRAAGIAAPAWGTRRPGSNRGRWRRASRPVSKCPGDNEGRLPCRTREGHSRPQAGGTVCPPASAAQVTGLGEGRDYAGESSGLRERQAQSSASTQQSKPTRQPPSLRSPHLAARTAVPVGALGPRTQRAVMGEAAGVLALLRWER